MYDSQDVDKFRDAMSEWNIIPPTNIIPDGNFHRADVNGPHGKNDASYILNSDFDDVLWGGFENHKNGRGWKKWCSKSKEMVSPEKWAEICQKQETARKKYAKAQAQRYAEAAERACRIWDGAGVCPDNHGYLQRKGLKSAYGARLHEGALVLPMQDADGAMHSLQFISADGIKHNMNGGRKKACFYMLGAPGKLICIAEGFATAASIFEATGYAVAAAFDCENLLSVAQSLRRGYADATLILCADDDAETTGNPGRTKAGAAASMCGGVVSMPVFADPRPDGATDFNDLAKAQGLEAVRACVQKALPKSGEEPVCCKYNDGFFSLDGVKLFYNEKGKDDSYKQIHVSTAIRVKALTRNADSSNWGRQLEWNDRDGTLHSWAMPAELLQGDPADVTRELVRQGVDIMPGRKMRDLLLAYLQLSEVKRRVRCVGRLGWDENTFVLPDAAIGAQAEEITFQNAHAIKPAYSSAATVECWQVSIAAMATGNSRLVFGICIALAGTLLKAAGEDSGGFHFYGRSSSGKTTILKAMGSVWGKPEEFIRLWRATSNGLEGLAALHNDCVLLLDELSQVNPKLAAEIAYLLANGQGRARANRYGAVRAPAMWRLLFASTGEETLRSLMARNGQRINAGQEIRLADIEADAGAGMGVFEDIHGYASPADFAETLKTAASQNYGAVGIAWLRCVVSNSDGLQDFLENGMDSFVKEVTGATATGQVRRVSRRFALVAMAGEMASHYGLTGWAEGEAIQAAKICFEVWLKGFGTTPREEGNILQHIKAFFESQVSRFEDASVMMELHPRDRVGFFMIDGSDRTYFVYPEAFKRELCNGYPEQQVRELLKAKGWIKPGTDGRDTVKPNIASIGKSVRVYEFTDAMWDYLAE